MGSCREKGAPGAGQEQQWGCWPRCQPGAGAHECPSQGRTRGRPHAPRPPLSPCREPWVGFCHKAQLYSQPGSSPPGRRATSVPWGQERGRGTSHQMAPEGTTVMCPSGKWEGRGSGAEVHRGRAVLRGRGNKGPAGDSFREDTSSSARSALPVTQPSPHRCEGGELSVDADPGTQALRTPGSLPRLCLMDGTLGHRPTARPTPRHPAPQPSGASAESTGLGVGVSSSSFPTKGTCSSWVTSAPSSLNQG